MNAQEIGKQSVGKKSIDLNLVSSATSTPINCKSMNGFKEAPAGSIHDSSVKKKNPSQNLQKETLAAQKASKLRKRTFKEIQEDQFVNGNKQSLADHNGSADVADESHEDQINKEEEQE